MLVVQVPVSTVRTMSIRVRAVLASWRGRRSRPVRIVRYSAPAARWRAVVRGWWRGGVE
eukprot:COSAG01_NODE_61221_length_290_cov_1.497382_1_plen_58_part_10